MRAGERVVLAGVGKQDAKPSAVSRSGSGSEGLQPGSHALLQDKLKPAADVEVDLMGIKFISDTDSDFDSAVLVDVNSCGFQS